MHKKALTVAIAGALAAPMAAQAVDFTISGHVNRALVLTDRDAGESTTKVKDHGSSGTRVRFTGSSASDAGVNVGINLELGVNEESDDQVSVRQSAVWFGGEFGTITIGHTNEAADGSVYENKSNVFGVGHGQEKGDSTAGDYVVGSEAGRRDVINFSSAALGPASIHLTYATDTDKVEDRASAKIKLAGGDDGFASYGASVAFLQWEEGTVDKSEIGGSLAVKLQSGITGRISGAAWGKDADGSFVQAGLGYIFGNNAVEVSWYNSSDIMKDARDSAGEKLTYDHDSDAETDAIAIPSIGDGTAVGIGFKHTLPKAGAEIIASVQSYSADYTYDSDPTNNAPDAVNLEVDDVVAIIGARVLF